MTEITTPMPLEEDVRANLVAIFASHNFEAGFAKYFWSDVCAPIRRPFENPTHRGRSGWDFPYQDRMTICALAYIRMPNKDRAMLHAGVEDGVKWMGEPIEQFVDVCNETAILREVGVPAYIARSKAAIEKLEKTITV